MRINYFLSQLFTRLNQRNTIYSIIGSYDRLSEKANNYNINDVDFWIEKSSLKKFINILIDVAKETNWEIIKFVPRFPYSGEGHYFFSKIPYRQFIHLDLSTFIYWRGISYIDEKILYKHFTSCGKTFYIPFPGIESSILLLKGLLYHGLILEKYKSRIIYLVNKDIQGFLEAIKKPFGNKAAYLILNMAKAGKWKDLEKKCNSLRWTLFKRALLIKPFFQLKYWTIYLRGQLKKFIFFSNGFFLVFLGPDGSGKSTTFHNLKKSEIKRLFQKIYYFHGHFPFLPELKRIVAIFKSNCNSYQSSGNISSSKPMSTLRSIIYPLYYGFNYFLGHFFIWKEKSRGNLIVFDRYFYDYFIQNQYIHCPKCLLNTIAKIIPKPDIIVYLKNTPRVIYNRKPELTIEEIEKQARICEDIVKIYKKNSYLIETTTPEEVTEKIQRLIVNKMREKQRYKK